MLSDIYFAHICTLFIENQLINELRSIAQETLNDSYKLIVSTSELIQMDSSQYIEDNESSIKLHEVEDKYDKNQQALQIWTEALPATKIFTHELELNLIAD